MKAGQLNTNAIFRLSHGYRFQWEPGQQRHVLLYPEGMVQLNETAAAILSFCDGKHSVADILERVTQEFDATDYSDDIKEFLGEAYGRGWLRLVE